MALSRFALVCAAVLLTACATPASRDPGMPDAVTGGDVTSAPEIAAAEEKDPIVCESIVRTGTRVAERRCMRRSEKERQQQGGQDALGEWQRRSVQVGNKSE